MSDFDEPWQINESDGSGFLGDMRYHRHAERAVACVNALAGIGDPAKFVARAKAMDVLLALLELMTPGEIAAIAAEWTDGEPHPSTVAEAIYGSENGR